MEAEAAVDLATWIWEKRMNWTLFPWELWQLWALEKSLDHKRPTQKKPNYQQLVPNFCQLFVANGHMFVLGFYMMFYEKLDIVPDYACQKNR